MEHEITEKLSNSKVAILCRYTQQTGEFYKINREKHTRFFFNLFIYLFLSVLGLCCGCRLSLAVAAGPQVQFSCSVVPFTTNGLSCCGSGL